RPVASASGIIVTNVLDLARISQPKVSQNPQCTQAARPRYGCERIAIGAGNAVHPILRAPRSARTPDGLIGSGGRGYGLLRGGSKGLAPARPETPISHSTFV